MLSANLLSLGCGATKRMANLELDEVTIELIQERVAKGEFSDAAAVVREGLRLLQVRETRTRLDKLLEESRAQYDRGEFQVWSPTFMDNLVREVEENERQGIVIETDPDVV